MQSGFTVRAMTAEDGPAIKALSDQSTDTGAVGFHNLYLHDAYATMMALHENACGVVAEAPDHPGIVGMGMMSLGECQLEGKLRPFAYLFSLSVHPDYRRRGIASALAGWRVRTARERFGDEGVIYAGVQQGNTGSLRTAARWSNQVISGRTMPATVKIRAKPIQRMPQNGLEVRPAKANDFEEIAHKQNAFYANYNLYPPRTAEGIQSWHAFAPFGEPIRNYYVVQDKQGNLLAGTSVTEEGKLIIIEVQRLSSTLKIANQFLHLFPADGKMKRLHVKDFWFAPGQLEIGQFLWESLRWQLRDRGNIMMMFIEPKTALDQVVRLPWYMPKTGGSFVISAPVPVSNDRPLYLIV